MKNRHGRKRTPKSGLFHQISRFYPFGVNRKSGLLSFLVIILVIIGITACSVANISSYVEPLPTVTPLTPPQLPDWIEDVNPTGEAQPLQQIRIRFKEALIPLENIDSDDQKSKLKYFEIIPKIPGEFRFLTPRMVGFQPEQALPKSTRFKVTIKSGLTNLKNQRLNQDLAWTFNTESIKLSHLPNSYPADSPLQPIDIKPNLKFTSNLELDLSSVSDNIKLIPEGHKTTIALKIEPEKMEPQKGENEIRDEETETPAEKFDPSVKQWNYSIIPQIPLEKATKYRLEFNSGLRPLRGNLPSQTPFVSQVETYSPLAFEGIKFVGKADEGSTDGRFVKGAAQLTFNNGIIAESALKNITINPPPKKAPKLLQAYDNESTVSLNPWALEPTTKYTITIGGNVKDKFGQTLGKPVKLEYETGDITADIWAPSGLNIFPSGKDLQLNISTINLPDSKYKAAFKVVQPTDLVYQNYARAQENGKGLLPPTANWKEFRVSPGKKNETQEVIIPLKEQLNATTGMLAYGVQARTNLYQENNQEKWREPLYDGLVQLTNLGVFAQWFPESGLIRVNHLSDGNPVAASVEIYQSQLEAKSQPKPIPCVTGKTDKSGTWLVSGEELKKCLNANSEKGDKAPKLLVIARENQDWAFTRTEEYSGSYGYGIDAGWSNGKPVSRGVIFSDRALYQPGETVWLTGTAYYLKNGMIQQDKNTPYQVTLESPDGKKTDLGTHQTNDFGTFSLKYAIASNQKLGNYQIVAKSDKGVEITGKMQVAEFKPPNFKVDLSLDKEFAVIGDKIQAETVSNYLFGSPVEGGKAKYYVTRRKTEFIPKGWEEFSFGRKWFWPENSPTITSDVLQKDASLDKNGKGTEIFAIPSDLPYPMKYQVDVEISDVSNLSVANSQTLTVLPSSRLIGLQSNFVADAQKPFPILVIVTDAQGNAIEGQKIRLELQQINYSSVTRVIEGSRTPKNQIEYKTIAQQEVTSNKTPQTVSLTPPDSGSYRIRANFANSNEEVTATDLQIWATGNNGVNWGNRYQNNRLEVKLNKTRYQPGEIATALIQSPYPEAELYFAVIRDKPLYQKLTQVKGAAPQIQFTVTPEMLPNAAVEAVLVRQGKNLEQGENVDKLVKVGFAPFDISFDEKYLQVKVTPKQGELLPGKEQTVELELKDKQGNPVKGQFTLMAVNDAVLQLTGYRVPDLVKTVYASQPISTRFGDNRPDVVLEQMESPLAKGWGYGGGVSEGLANTRTRINFQPLAYYDGSVLTDEKGKATVTFTLPDDLTTWRVMALGTDGNLRFGNGENTFISTKALISNPLLPQFARLRDRVSLGLSITNKSQEKGTLNITAKATGAIEFAGNNPTTETLQTPVESGTNGYRFPIIAETAGEGKIKFTTTLNNNSDSFEIPLSVKPLEVTESVVETGVTSPNPPMLRGGEVVKIPLNFNNKVVPDVGGLEIYLASSLIPEIIAPAKQVFAEDNLPFLEPLSSQLSIASNLQTLSQKYGKVVGDFNPKQEAEKALRGLQQLQLADGGFAVFPGLSTSEPYLTAYAANAIALSAQTFPELVDMTMVDSLKNYLKTTLAEPGKSDFCKEKLCQNQVRLKMLIALAHFGEKRNDFLIDIYQQREEYSPVTQIELARYLSQLKDWQKEANLLTKEIEKNIAITGRNATVSLPANLSWLNSPTAIQAQTLRLFLSQEGKKALTTNLLQSLLTLRRNGTWLTTYDNAEALTALVEYSKTEPTPPQFNVTVKLGGQKIDAIVFDGYKNANRFLTLGMDKLPRNKTELTLEKSGKGTLHYLVNYNYRVEGNPPGRVNGLRVIRQIRAAGEDKVLAKQRLYAPDPVKLPIGQIFDIGLEIISDRAVNHVIINEPLPAGLEAIDNSFKTTNQAIQVKEDSWGIKYKMMYRDRIFAYAEHLDPGVYSVHYLARSVTPGTYFWPGGEAHLQYAPEEFGRTASSTLILSEK
jgi:alpha-2-macroglobulin